MSRWPTRHTRRRVGPAAGTCPTTFTLGSVAERIGDRSPSEIRLEHAGDRTREREAGSRRARRARTLQQPAGERGAEEQRVRLGERRVAGELLGACASTPRSAQPRDECGGGELLVLASTARRGPDVAREQLADHASASCELAAVSAARHRRVLGQASIVGPVDFGAVMRGSRRIATQPAHSSPLRAPASKAKRRRP